MSVIVGGIYEHYKKKMYKVIGIAQHSETLEKLVVYQALYGEKKLWVRPEEMFCEKIEKDGLEIERFKYICESNQYENNIKVSLKLSSDIRNYIYENNIDIEKELSKQIEDISLGYEKNEDDVQSKDLAMVIIASGVSITLVVGAIAKVIQSILHRPRVVEIFEKDHTGNIIKKETVILQPHQPHQKSEIKLDFTSNNLQFIVKEENGD